MNYTKEIANLYKKIFDLNKKICCIDQNGGGVYLLSIEDTTTIDLDGDGTEDNPLLGNVNVSDSPNNAIHILGDGLFVQNVVQSGLVYGGIVTWLDNYNYHISAAGYYINYQFYESPAANFTLTGPDSLFNRVDAFIVDNTSQASVLEGTPSANPAITDIDPATQLLLSFALVEVGTTQPTLGTECLYIDNNEWTTLSSNLTKINPDSGVDPCNGSKSVEFTSAVTGDNILFSRGSNFTPASLFTKLKLTIKSKGFSGNANLLRVQWENSGTPIGTAANIRNFAFGFQPTNTSSCQTITIPISYFGLLPTTVVNSLRITASTVVPGGIGLFIDDICLQDQPVAEVPNVGNTYTSNNAITENPSKNFQLGGSLIKNTTINSTSYNFLITGSDLFGINSGSLVVENTSSGNALRAIANSGYAIVASSVSGDAAIQAYSESNKAVRADTDDGIGVSSFATGSGVGISAGSQSGVGGMFQSLSSQGIRVTSFTNTAGYFSAGAGTASGSVKNALTLDGSGNTGAAIGSGVSLTMQMPASGGTKDSGKILTRWTDSTLSGATADFVLQLSDSGSLYDVISIIGDTGRTRLHRYGLGAITGTPAYQAAFDASGNIIEIALGGGSGIGGTLTAGRVPFAQDASTLIDSANFTWDNINHKLLIGSGTSTAGILTVNGGNQSTTSGQIQVQVSGSTKFNIASGNSQTDLYAVNHSIRIYTNGTGNLSLISNGSTGITYNAANAAGSHYFQIAGSNIVNIDSTGLTIPRLKVTGSTSGVVTIEAIAATGTPTITLPSVTGTLATLAGTETLTNKRINPRVGTIASSATPTPDANSYDVYTVTALATNATFAAPSGTSVDGQQLLIRIKDNGVARTLNFDVIYRAGSDVALPTTTVVSETMYLQFIYNSADTKWDFTGFTQGF